MSTRRYLIALFAALALVAATLLVWPALRRAMMSRNCLANMKSMGYEATVWAKRNGGTAPTNWLCFSDELISPKMMLCPADSGTSPALNWTSFGPQNTSYEILSAGGRWGDANRVFFRCRIHRYVCLADGSVLRQAPPPQ